VLVEAMACGLPVVASRIGGIPSIVEDGQTGSLIPPGDAQALTRKIDDLLSTPERTRTMGVASRSRAVRKFSIERMITETEQVFIKAAESGGIM
jgi:starch synthase